MIHEMAAALRPHHQANLGLQSVAIASGKGGIGKTNVVANLAAALSALNKRCAIIDADFALSNLDTLLGLTPRWHLGHFLSGEKSLDEVMVKGPGGIRILSAARGLSSSSAVPELLRDRLSAETKLVDEVKRFASNLDFLMIDPPSGRSASVGALMGAASRAPIVVDPEPASLMDAYFLVKWLRTVRGSARLDVVVNAAIEECEAFETYRQLMSVVARFLHAPMSLFGWIPYDPALAVAARRQKLVVNEFPDCPSSLAFRELAQRLLTETVMDWSLPNSVKAPRRMTVRS